uniref:Uncharacterized protein n=1 Tax=Vitis vinifera TaxID=29760 RepID=F6H8G2_VITVI
MLDVGEFLN